MVLSDDEELTRDVYAHFGLAYYMTECVHRALVNVFAMLPFTPVDAARPRVEERMKVAEQMTLGELVSNTKPLLNADLLPFIDWALAKRNLLAHGFWYERIHSMSSADGKRDLVAELTQATERAALLAAACQPSGNKLGLRREAQKAIAAVLKSAAAPPMAAAQVDLMARWREMNSSPAGAAEVMGNWAQLAAAGRLPAGVDEQFQVAFEQWFTENHTSLVFSPARELLPIHEVVPHLDREVRDRPMLLVVLDAMGLLPWYAVLDEWRFAGSRLDAETRVVLAAAPTITSVSRLSLIAGDIQPSGFLKSDRAKAERDAWAKRFEERDIGGHSQVINVSWREDWRQVFSDRIAQGASRLAVVDVSWDKMMHELDMHEGDIVHHVRRWARSSAAREIREITEEALDADYRVFVTADHGCTAAIGNGRVQTGDLVEEGSKRVLLFKTADSASAYGPAGFLWQPQTCPKGLHTLFARPNESFDIKGVPSFSHGGLSPSEALVPLAELRKSGPKAT